MPKGETQIVSFRLNLFSQNHMDNFLAIPSIRSYLLFEYFSVMPTWCQIKDLVNPDVATITLTLHLLCE